MSFVRRHFFAVWCATMLMAVVILAVLIGLLVRASVDRGEERACERTNVLRASTNRRARNFFDFNSLEVALIQAGLKHQTNSVKRTPEQVRQTRLFLAKLSGLVADEEWIGLTDCHAAVHTGSYQPPVPVRFSVRQPPPSALA